MVFRSCYDDVVDIDARTLDHARVEAAVSDDVFDLDDDFTATVVNGLATEVLSKGPISSSMVILPDSSAYVPRRKATLTGKVG